MSDPDEDDVLAAEYVLGTLSFEERTSLERRLASDGGFRHLVGGWEDRLSPLLGLYPEISPPPHLRSTLLAQLESSTPEGLDVAPGSNIIVLKQSVRRWRIVAAGAVALAAALALWIVVEPRTDRGGRFVAVLQKDADSPAILLAVDVAARRVEIQQVASTQPSGKSYELWLINPEVGAPRSLGVLRPQGVTDASLAPFDAAVIARATYAITEEAPGGSVNGVPSGPPVLTGRLVSQTP